MSNAKYAKVWVGYESERDQIRKIAHQIVVIDKTCETKYGSCLGVLGVVRDSSLADGNLELLTYAMLLKELRSMTEDLVHNKHLDYNMIRREYAAIMDPINGV